MEDFIDIITGIAIFVAIVAAFGKRKNQPQKTNAPSRSPFGTSPHDAERNDDTSEWEPESEGSPDGAPCEAMSQEDVTFSYETIPQKEENEPFYARTTSATSSNQPRPTSPPIIEDEENSPNVDLSEEGIKQGIIYSEIFKPRYNQ